MNPDTVFKSQANVLSLRAKVKIQKKQRKTHKGAFE